MLLRDDTVGFRRPSDKQKQQYRLGDHEREMSRVRIKSLLLPESPFCPGVFCIFRRDSPSVSARRLSRDTSRLIPVRYSTDMHELPRILCDFTRRKKVQVSFQFVRLPLGVRRLLLACTR